jgi:hypothetical protein
MELDRRAVPFRRPWAHVPHGGMVALGALVVVLTGVGGRLGMVARCSEDGTCPAVAEARAENELGGVYVWGDAEGRGSLVGYPTSRARAAGAPIIGQTVRDTPEAAAIRAARAQALVPRWWEAAALVLAVLVLGVALVERQLRFAPVVLDAQGLRVGRARFLWEDLAAAGWEADRIVLTGRDREVRVIEGLDLADAEQAELQRLSDRLVGQRTGARPDGLDRVRELAGSAVGR